MKVSKMRKHRKRAFGLAIHAALLAGMLAAQSGPQPGSTDPIGSTGHLTLFPDDELFSFSPDGGNTTRLYRTDGDTKLSLLNATYLQTLSNSSDPIVAASGRVTDPSHSSVVMAQRVSGTSMLGIQVFGSQPAGPVNLPGLQDRSLNTDIIAVAAGDLDKTADSQHNYHDEVVAAYATGNNTVRIAVLNYTNWSASNPKISVSSIDAPGLAYDDVTLAASDIPISVAVGDFDGDGNNEFAVVYPLNYHTYSVRSYRYVSDGNGGGTIQGGAAPLLNLTPPAISYGGPDGPLALATVSLQAGDFNNDGIDELAIGYAFAGFAYDDATGEYTGKATPAFCIVQFDKNLNPAIAGKFRQPDVSAQTGDKTMPLLHVQLAAGQFLFNPPATPFGQKQIAIGWNDVSNQAIDIQAYSVSDLASVTPIGATVYAQTTPDWPGIPTQQFSLVAGGFTGNANINSPTASLAVSAWTSNGTSQGVYWIRTIAVNSGGLSFADLRSFATGPTNSIGRFPLVATDWDGKSVYLGAPAHITIENAISTDYILEEPPKHSFWDGTEVYTVTNYDSNNVGFTYAAGATSSTKSTDHSNWTIGGSAEISAGATVGVSEDAFIAKTNDQASVDVTAKGSYDYNKNKDNYNSQYGSRTFTIGSTTDHDDYLSGRLQTIDVWRYRIYGITQTDPNTNNFYDIMLPGPTIPYYGGGLDFDWYQPVHENGNILTYPQMFNSSGGNPPDLGSYTDSNGNSVTAPLVPITQWAFDGTSGTEKLDLSTAGGSGNSVDYSHTLAESLDVKASASTSAEVAGVSGEARVSGELEFHNSNSWGKATTSDNTTTTETTITLTKGSSDSSQTYVFDPITYMTQDGTFKMSFVVPNPGSSGLNPAGSEYWSSKYGAYPDPALNLPQRFSPTYSSNNVQNGWALNPGSARKKMRGLFFRRATINPDTNDYDFLNAAAVDGDQVRIEARVYNESTAVGADNITVQFQKIAYDSGNDNEICDAPINAGLAGGKLCPASARTVIGQTSISHLDALQFTCLSGTDDPGMTGCNNNPVFINWDTKGSGPDNGTNEYRIYVVLIPENAQQLYGSDGTPQSIQNMTNATPIKVTTTSPHGIHTGDYVTIGETGMQLPSDNNQIFQVTYVDDTNFTLDGSTDVGGAYSGGGTVTLINPGENDEGYRQFDVQAPSLQGAPGEKFDDYLNKHSLRAIDLHTDKLTDSNVAAYQNRPVRIRVGVFSSATHPQGANLLLFDGNPAAGAPAIASQLVHPGNNGGKGTHIWFDWTPTTTGTHQLYAKLLESGNDAKIGNNVSSLQVDVFRTGDLNGDGQVNRADLNEMLRNLGKSVSRSSCGPACDLNRDGFITVLDVRKLVLICGERVCGDGK